MKVIFLDFDGVINSQKFYHKRHRMLMSGELTHKQMAVDYPFWDFCPELVNNLNKIVKLTGAKVVVSSTWRKGRRLGDLQAILNMIGFKGEVIDKTPELSFRIPTDDTYTNSTVPRGCEIDRWLQDNGNFQRINWSKDKQLEYLEKSKVKNYIILDDDSDMLYKQREHFIKTNTYSGLGDFETALAIKILNTPLVDLYYPD